MANIAQAFNVDPTTCDAVRDDFNGLFFYRVTIFEQLIKGCDSSMHKSRKQHMFDTGATIVCYNKHASIWDVTPVNDVVIEGIGSFQPEFKCCGIWGYGLLVRDLPFTIVGRVALEAQGIRISYDSIDTNRDFSLDLGAALFRHNESLNLSIMSNQEAMIYFRGRECKRQSEGSQLLFPIGEALLPLEDEYMTRLQRVRADAVKRMHTILDHPSDEVLTNLLEKAIINCPYTGADVRRMRKRHGPCQACLKGETVSLTHSPVSLRRHIPERPGQHIGMDVYFMTVISRSGKKTIIPLLLTLCYFSRYRHVTRLKSKTTEEVWACLNRVLMWYRSYGHSTQIIFCDRENVLGSLRPMLAEFEFGGIRMETCATDQHEVRLERAVRDQRAKFRTVKAALWYPLPQYLFVNLMEDCATMENALTNSMLNDERSPIWVVTGRKLDFNLHVRVPFGTFGEF